jgi:hypothetical protein
MNKLKESIVEMLCKLKDDEFERKTGYSLTIESIITMAQACAENLEPNDKFYKQSNRKGFDRKKKEQLERRCYNFNGN